MSILTRVRCPGCGQSVLVDEDATHPDEALEIHTTTDCERPDDTICERVGFVKPAARSERRRARQRVRDQQRRRKRKGSAGVDGGSGGGVAA